MGLLNFEGTVKELKDSKGKERKKERDETGKERDRKKEMKATYKQIY